MIISVPVHTAVWESRGSGALVVLVATQLLVAGVYLPPVLKSLNIPAVPPQTIIWLPVQTALCPARGSGALVVVVAVHESVLGL